jgi:hypothetical protein
MSAAKSEAGFEIDGGPIGNAQQFLGETRETAMGFCLPIPANSDKYYDGTHSLHIHLRWASVDCCAAIVNENRRQLSGVVEDQCPVRTSSAFHGVKFESPDGRDELTMFVGVLEDAEKREGVIVRGEGYIFEDGGLLGVEWLGAPDGVECLLAHPRGGSGPNGLPVDVSLQVFRMDALWVDDKYGERGVVLTTPRHQGNREVVKRRSDIEKHVAENGAQIRVYFDGARQPVSPGLTAVILLDAFADHVVMGLSEGLQHLIEVQEVFFSPTQLDAPRRIVDHDLPSET